MATVEEFKQRPATFTVLANGLYGSGKTHLGMTFPKVYYLGFEPSGLDILRIPENKELLGNLVEYEYIEPSTPLQLKEWFEKGGRKGKLYQCLDKAKQMFKDGKVTTLFTDNVTYFVDKYWQYINEYHKVFGKTGNLDTQGMYGQLRQDMFFLFSGEILSFGGNIVASCHLKRESEKTMEGTEERAGKVDKSSDLAPQILGSFRDLIPGLFGAVIYLDQKSDGKRVAYCTKQRAFDTVIYAKNRYGLPPIVENISYKTLWDSNRAKGEVKVTSTATNPGGTNG